MLSVFITSSVLTLLSEIIKNVKKINPKVFLCLLLLLSLSYCSFSFSFFNSVCFHILLTAATQYYLKYFFSSVLWTTLCHFFLKPFLFLCFSFSSIPFSCLYKIYFFLKVFLAYPINTWERTVSVIGFALQPTAASLSPERFACSRK